MNNHAFIQTFFCVVPVTFCVCNQDGDLEEMPLTQLLKYLVDKRGKRPQKRHVSSSSSRIDTKKRRLDLTDKFIDISSGVHKTSPSGASVVDAQEVLATGDAGITAQSPLLSAQLIVKQENTEDAKNEAEDAEKAVVVNNLSSSEATAVPSASTSPSPSLVKNPDQSVPRMDNVISSETTPAPPLSSDETPPQSPALASQNAAMTAQEKPVPAEHAEKLAVVNDVDSTPPPSLSSDETPPQSPASASQPPAKIAPQKPVSTEHTKKTLVDDVVPSEATALPSPSSAETPPQSPTLTSQASALTDQQKPDSTDIPASTKHTTIVDSSKAIVEGTTPGVAKLADSAPNKQVTQRSKSETDIPVSSDATKIEPKNIQTTDQKKLQAYKFSKSDVFEQFVAVIHEDNLGMVCSRS